VPTSSNEAMLRNAVKSGESQVARSKDIFLPERVTLYPQQPSQAGQAPPPRGGRAVAAGSKVNRDGSKVENCILREITIDPLFGGGSEEAGA
jgi:hypothetical protein